MSSSDGSTDDDYESAIRSDAKRKGYGIELGDNKIIAKNVPCLIAGGKWEKCIIEVRKEGFEEFPDAKHVAKVLVPGGKVYNRQDKEIGSVLSSGDDYCFLSIKSNERDERADGEINLWKRICPYLFTISCGGELEDSMADWWRKVQKCTVGIIGVGGTGGHILDQMSKAGVKKIVLWDGDSIEKRNLLRVPGPATAWKGCIGENKAKAFGERYKGEYCDVECRERYFSEREDAKMDCIDFAFVAVDKAKARREIISVLSSAKIPYADVGMGVWVQDGELRGGCQAAISNQQGVYDGKPIQDGGVFGGNNYYRAVQVSEIHAYNAAMAVMLWRRAMGQMTNSDVKLWRHDLDFFSDIQE